MPNPSERSRLWPALIGLTISAGLIWYAIRGVDLRDVGRHLAAAHALPLAGAVVLATLTFPIRAVRWRYLLRDARDEPITWSALWHATAIGFMANNVLPFRLGELIRPLAVTRLADVRFTAAFSSIAIERIFDGLTLALLLGLALLSPGLGAGVEVGGVSVAKSAAVGGAVFLLLLAVAIGVVLRPLAAERVVRALLPRGRLAERLVRLIEGIRQGLAVLQAPKRAAAVVVWSLVLWLVNALAFYVGFAAFDIRVDFTGAVLLEGLVAFGVSLPSTPGYLGPFEASIRAALSLYGIAPDRSFSYAIAYHVTTFVPITLLGLWSLTRTPLALKDLRRASAP
ncbi:MAG TPA: lysylphosphatidylglycerol synthase transmembrane domain-containing protein [Gemmatimonadales bacterium]|nr:lysylphosphatidylglycerol synthase transmembrane domain-containing protein [Gemmatimonadales bacterium]